MLHGAYYETQIDGTRVEVTTDVDFENSGLTTNIELGDNGRDTVSLGGVDFPEFLSPLPLEIHATAYPGSQEVGRTILDRFEYLSSLKADAEQKVDDAAQYFVTRAGVGLGGGALAGVTLTELAAAARRKRQPNDMTGNHPLLKSFGYSGLALTVLAGGGAFGGMNIRPDTSYYSPHGLIAAALKSQNELSRIAINSPVLESMIRDFQKQHACPETPLARTPDPGNLTVTTYNIKRGRFGEQGIQGIESQLANTRSSVIFLQEATKETAAQLAADLGMQAVNGWTIERPGLTYGNSILIAPNLKVGYTEYIPLPAQNSEPRGAIVAELTAENGEPFLVADTHLSKEILTPRGDSNAAARKTQAQVLTARLAAIRQGNEAVVLGGDMNERVSGPAYDVFDRQYDDTVAEQLTDTSTFPANGARFDNIFMNNGAGWKTVSASVGGGNNSDHCLVSVSLGMSGQYVTERDTLSAAEPIDPSPYRQTGK